MFFLKYLPFSLHWIIKSNVDKKIKTIIDLGCGDGSFTKDISSGEDWVITGLELYDSSIRQAKKLGIYKHIIRGDITKIPEKIKHKKYDLTLAIQVIEHLNKQQGELALKKWESLARRKIIISTPVGYIKFDRVEKEKDKNKLQKHLSGWSPEEFRQRGYKVYGQGLKIVYGENGLVRKLHPIFWPFLILFSYLLAPVVYQFPKMGAYMIAVKIKI